MRIPSQDYGSCSRLSKGKGAETPNLRHGAFGLPQARHASVRESSLLMNLSCSWRKQGLRAQGPGLLGYEL